MARLVVQAQQRLATDGVTDEQVLEAIRIRPITTARFLHVLWRAQGVFILGTLSAVGVVEASPPWNVLAGAGLAATVAGVVWIFLPLVRTDPTALLRLPVPRTAALVLTDRSVRVYRYWGAVTPVLQELSQVWPLTEIVAVQGPAQATTGGYRVHRLALAFSDETVLLVDTPEDRGLAAAQRLVDEIARRTQARRL